MPGFSDRRDTDDMKDLRATYERELNGYGRAGENGFAQVPIDRAMDLAVERGLFKTAQPPGRDGGAAPATQPRNPQRQGGQR